MTVTQSNGRLNIRFVVSGDTTRNEGITGIKPTASDQDCYDIANAIANLIDNTLSSIQRSDYKSYSA